MGILKSVLGAETRASKERLRRLEEKLRKHYEDTGKSAIDGLSSVDPGKAKRRENRLNKAISMAKRKHTLTKLKREGDAILLASPFVMTGVAAYRNKKQKESLKGDY